ncbi:MAG TPA: hypothetical protein VM759_08430, partial [Longimicrobium sp.]|nr:hypothetical protein [Longimicrobium sp.]
MTALARKDIPKSDADPTVPPETAAEAEASVRRASAVYFALQGVAVLAWWAMLWQMPATREWFTAPGWPRATLTAFWLPDIVLLAGGSLAAGWLSVRGGRAASAARWLVA